MTAQRQVHTGNQTFIRDMNLSTLLCCLPERAPLSRSGLSGLVKATVSSLAQQLLEQDLVQEIGLEPSSGARPAALLELSPEAGWYL